MEPLLDSSKVHHVVFLPPIDYFGNIVQTLQPCTATQRYADFFTLVHLVTQTKTWEILTLENLLTAVNLLVRYLAITVIFLFF